MTKKTNLGRKPEGAGGKREGAGRKLKYGEETISVNYRVPKSKKPEVDELVNDRLRNWIKNKWQHAC